MAVLVSLLRGINIGGHHKIAMAELRAVYESLRLRDVQTHINSGNVLFRTGARDLTRLGRQIETAIEHSVGFRPTVILRSPDELRNVVATNPFALRDGLDPSRLAIMFLAAEPDQDACDRLRRMNAGPEELHISGRELCMYYPNGMARPSLAGALIEKVLKTSGTARNWNTVRKLLQIAEEMQRSSRA